MSILKLTPAIALSMALAAALSPAALSAHPHSDEEAVDPCADAEMIGRFDPSKDLLIANYDSKPDVDDLQSVAGLGSVLAHPDFACVNYIATAGAYGTQDGEFIHAPVLFNLAFGDRWVDAHADRDAAVDRLREEALATLQTGGKVWITEAGQSDVSAAMVRGLPEELWGNVHLVQHSDWNEATTSEADIYFVRRKVRYHRISDGNFPGNGSPSFNTHSPEHWPALLNDPTIGAIWVEAKRLSDLHNPAAAYVNPAVSDGGLDFSDTVEPSYVFGFDDMADVGDFVARFARGG